MILTDARTPCVTPDAVRNRLKRGVRAGELEDDVITDAIADVTAEAETFLKRRIDLSQIKEQFEAADVLELTITPILFVTSVTDSSGTQLLWTRDGNVVTLDAQPTSSVTVEYAAGIEGTSLASAAGIIKRAAIRVITNPSGVIQSGGPGQPFHPEPSGVQAVLTKSERDSLRRIIPFWGIA